MNRKLFNTTLMALCLLLPTLAQAVGNLMVTPTRVVFEDRMRSAQVTVVNTGAEIGDFRASMVRRNMTESGDFIEVPEGEAGLYSDELVRYSPRQFTLPPGQSQVIRIMLRKPRSLEDGEYRSHLLFQALPDPDASIFKKDDKEKIEGIQVEIVPIVGVTIPVIVRHGNLAFTATLDNLVYTPDSENEDIATLSFDMHREGNRSAYGDFRVIFKPTGTADKYTVGQANGVAVYSPNDKRNMTLKLQRPAGVKFDYGQFELQYIEPAKTAENGLIARASISIP